MTDRPDKLQAVHDLTWALLDDRLEPADQAKLNDLLFGDPEACELYLNLVTLHAHLVREHGGAAPPVVSPAGIARPASRLRFLHRVKPSWPTISWRSGGYAAAACVLMAVGLTWVLSRGTARAEPADACVTVAELRDVVWAECSPPRTVGDRLSPCTVGLTRGTAVLRFDNGAVATLTGPVEMQIESRKGAELTRGSMSVRAEREAAGFTLRTAASDYIDLGTEFGVSVNDDASSEVHVFEGVVIARPRASDLVVPVLRNEAGRVGADRGDLVAIDSNVGKFPGVSAGLATTGRNSASAKSAATPETSAPQPLPAGARVVFLGDRATDLETHLLLLNQTFERLYGTANHPKLFNAAGAVPLALPVPEEAIARYVLSYRPTHAVLEFGPELAVAPRRRPAGQFEAELRALTARLAAAGVEPILSTGFRLGHHQAQCQGVLDEYNAAVRRVAADRRYRLADVDGHLKDIERFKLSLVASNGVVPTFTGYQEIAAVLLAAMGHPGERPDPTLRLSLLPGVVTHWQYRVKTADDPTAGPAGVASTTAWQPLVLPQTGDKFISRLPDRTHCCAVQNRSRGFATDLARGPNQTVEAVANVHSDVTRSVYVNVGSGVRAVRVNGQPLVAGGAPPTTTASGVPGERTGCNHPGRDRYPVTLKAGDNEIVVEAAGGFFLSVTDTFDWPVR